VAQQERAGLAGGVTFDDYWSNSAFAMLEPTVANAVARGELSVQPSVIGAHLRLEHTHAQATLAERMAW
jgi:hypothetical protein